MTEKLYDTDSYTAEFDGVITAVHNVDKTTTAVELDRTAFFPEGGGQTSDTGYLNDIFVKDVQIENGIIKHYIDSAEVKTFQIGMSVHGKIDWKKRFSDMQQHSGEHMFSGIVHSLFGYDNVGFHLSENEVTLDFNGTLDYDDLCKVEGLVNEAVWKNLEIKVSYPSEEELSKLDYRSKKELNEKIRIVEISGVDICACCAPHVKRTGEIGLVRVIAFQRHRGGTRVNILCGERALLDSRVKLYENHLVSNLLAAKETETFAAVKRLREENQKLSAEITSLRREIISLKSENVQQAKRIIRFVESESPDELLPLADSLSEKSDEFAAVFTKGEQKRFVIISKTDYDLNTLAAEMRKTLFARGGGRNGIVQGSVSASEDEIKNFFENN